MIVSRRAVKGDVTLFKSMRLKALKQSPEAFGSTYENAIKRTDVSWAEQLHSTIEGELS